jgi:hypothetical protein
VALETPARVALETPARVALETPARVALETPAQVLRTPVALVQQILPVRRAPKLALLELQLRMEMQAPAV